MACDRIERKVARADNLSGHWRGFAGERELVEYLLRLEREREALARRAQMHLVKRDR